MVFEDEHKRTADEVSKNGFTTMSKSGESASPKLVWRVPTSWPGGIRYRGTVSERRALVRNVRTCRMAAWSRQIAAPVAMMVPLPNWEAEMTDKVRSSATDFLPSASRN